jgi:ATP-dependent Lon protease
MRDFRDAKAMARRLREALAQKSVSLTHTDSLELIARSFGVKDWQVLAALIAADAVGPEAAPPPQLWTGPMLPLRDIVIFPKTSAPLFVGRERSRRALTSAFTGEQELLLVTQRAPEHADPSQEQLYEIGVVADVLQRLDTPDRGVKLLVRGRQRARLVRTLEVEGAWRAEAVLEPGAGAGADVAAAQPLAQAAATAFQAYAKGKEQLDRAAAEIAEIAHPGVLADTVAMFVRAGVAEKQAVLEMRDPMRRLAMALALIPASDARAA